MQSVFSTNIQNKLCTGKFVWINAKNANFNNSLSDVMGINASVYFVSSANSAPAIKYSALMRKRGLTDTVNIELFYKEQTFDISPASSSEIPAWRHWLNIGRVSDMLKDTAGQANGIPKGPAMLSASLFMKVYLPPVLGVHSLQAYCTWNIRPLAHVGC